MASILNLIKLLCNLMLVSFVKSAWELKILNNESIKTMEKGKFYDITIFFSEPNPKSFPIVTFILGNNQNVFKISKESYTINLIKENRIYTTIGVSCDTELKEAVLFFIPTSLDKFDSFEYLITLKDPELFKLSLQVSSPIISKGEYGIVFLKNYPLNVDHIEIGLKSSNALLDIDQYSIPAYNPIVLKNKIYAMYSLKSEGTSTESTITIEVELKSPTKCYSLEANVLSVKIGENTIINTKDQVVGFQLNPSAGISYLEILLTNYLTPSMIYCALVSTKQDFPRKTDIINQDFYHTNDNATSRYFKSFISKTMEAPLFKFDSLNKFESYKLRCVYENSAKDPKLLTSSLFSSSFPISIVPNNSPEAYCATWFLTKLVDKQFMEKAIMKHCEEDLIIRIPLSEYGCLHCVIRSLEGIINPEDIELSTSMCLTSLPTCTTINTKEDTDILAEGILFDFSSTEAIQEIFHTQIEMSKPTIIENFVQSSTNDFIFSSITHTSKLFSFSFAHIKGIPHDCSFELKCENPHIKDLKNETFRLKINEEKRLEFPIPSGEYDDNYYSFKVKCRPMPNLPSHSFKSEFYPLGFSHLKTIDCTNNSHIPQCYKITYLPMPSLMTENPKQDIESDIQEMKKRDFNEQRSILTTALQEYTSLTDEYEILNRTVMLGEIITCIDCISTQYAACRSIKSNITKQILISLRTYYPNGNIKKTTTNTYTHSNDQKETNTVYKVKLLLTGIFYATINIDAYTNDTSREILDYTGQLLKNSNELLLLVKEELKEIQNEKYIFNVNSDLINLYTAIVDNTINLTEYMQRDEYVFANHTKYGIVNYDKSIQQFTDSISSLINTTYKYQPKTTYINATNYDMTMNMLPNKINVAIYDFKVNGTNVTLSFPINSLFVFLKSKFIGVIYYKKSPFISYNSTLNYSTPIVNIKLYGSINENEDLSLIDLKTIEEIPFTVKYAIDKNAVKPHYCYFIKNFTLDTQEMITDQLNSRTPSCEMIKIFGDIAIGVPDLGGKVKFFIDTWMIVLGVIVLCVLATIVIYLIVFVCQGKKKAENLIEINQENIPFYNNEDMHSGN